MTAPAPAPPSPSPPTRITITTPPGWWDLPLDRSTRTRDLAALVDARLALTDAGSRPAVIHLLEEAAELADASGAVLASQIGVVGTGLSFAANVVIAVHQVAPAEGSTLADQVSRLSNDPADGVSDCDVVIDAVHLDGIGAATRRRSTRQVALGTATTVTFLCAQYFARVPESSAVAVATFTSPTLGAVEDLFPLFDAIASTIRFDGGQPPPPPHVTTPW